MSLKSFDKFCESLILTEPGSEKIIYDERQKIMQMKLGVETLIIFGAAAVLNCLVMDLFYQYAESYTMPIVIFMMLCAYYYNFRCAAKDCLIGINGAKALKYSSVSSIFVGIGLSAQFILRERDSYLPIADGQLSDDLLFSIAAVLGLGYGITMLILVGHIEKKKNGQSE
ncbi:MAG: hypothetical protein J1F60_02275 [Oscillospiraceae bacterium]|nr:hypothetical protein [Oscillospiraceae bacterium]